MARWILLLLAAIGIAHVAAEDGPRTNSENTEAASPSTLRALIPTLQPLHEKIHPPKPGDWLKEHEEPGQTFEEYLACAPVTPRGERRVICIQPLGDLKGRRKEIVDLAATFMAEYFGTPVRVMKPLALDVIPEESRRASRGFGEQIKSITVLYDVLKPRLPKDAAAYIAFTASDLYPEDDWNFVFGQASLRNRVGVWSLARFGDPDESEDAFRLCLLRTIKTATHETGHIFSMSHCILYECNMNGSNHQAESDAKPLWLCPECFAKILFATGQVPKDNLRQLGAFARKHGLKTEAEFYEKSAAKLEE